MRCIIFLGPPGAGKGTQAKRLAKKLNFLYFSTGEMLRAAIQSGTDLGQEIESIIKAGHLVSDDAVLLLIKENLLRLRNNCAGFVLDGFPRTLNQAKEFESVLLECSIDPKNLIVINLQVDGEELIRRIEGRFVCKICGAEYHKYYKLTKIHGVCDNCASKEFIHRQDDATDVVRARLSAYHSQTKPLIDRYAEVRVDVDGMRPIDDVSSAIEQAIDNYMNGIGNDRKKK